VLYTGPAGLVAHECILDLRPITAATGVTAEDVAKRLVDFAAGLVFGLHGSIERVTSKVFLLSPETVEVNAEESVAPAGRGVFNQS